MFKLFGWIRTKQNPSFSIHSQMKSENSVDTSSEMPFRMYTMSNHVLQYSFLYLDVGYQKYAYMLIYIYIMVQI